MHRDTCPRVVKVHRPLTLPWLSGHAVGDEGLLLRGESFLCFISTFCFAFAVLNVLAFGHVPHKREEVLKQKKTKDIEVRGEKY